MSLARSTFYGIKANPVNLKRQIQDEKIWEEIKSWWETFPGIGYKKLARYIGTGKARVLRILQNKRGRKVNKGKNKTQRKFPNLLKQILSELVRNKEDSRHKKFKIKDGKNKHRKLLLPTKPYQIWQCDWKEINIPVIKLKIYLFLIIDVYTRQIMGFSISLIKDHQSALKAIRMAAEKAAEDKLFNPKELIVHSDQGSAYLSNEYIAYLKHLGVKVSMADAGKPTQNPYIEAFISLISRFWLNHFEYLSFLELDQSIRKFIERYNNMWLHGEIGYITPNQKLTNYQSAHFFN